MNTTYVTEYLHGGARDEMSDLWPYEAAQQDTYRYSLYEVKIQLEVDLDTGKSRIVAVDDIPLTAPGEFH